MIASNKSRTDKLDLSPYHQLRRTEAKVKHIEPERQMSTEEMHNLFHSVENTATKHGNVHGKRQKEQSGKTSSHEEYDRSGVCKLPYLNPYDPAIKPIIGQTELKCKYESIIYENGQRLSVNWTAVKLSNVSSTFAYCTYKPISRPAVVTDHNYFEYGQESVRFTESIDVADEFIRVQCYNSSHEVVFQSFHQFVLLKEEVEMRCNKAFKEHLHNKTVKETMNVILLGIDSVSRLQSIRSLKRTRAYLLDVLGAVELTLYNKVADNTFVNIVPMTLGKFIEEMPYNESVGSNEPFDKYNFIWKQFSMKGYRTLFAEDAPNMGTFDYAKKGFHRYPTDYFNRHFSVAMDKERELWNTDELCVGNRLESAYILDYTFGFAHLHKHEPYFAFSFIARLTHDDFYYAQYADLPLFNFIKDLDEGQLLNNTLLIIFSDHGVRFGKVRDTYIGMMEERLPMMFLRFPPWFKEKYSFLWNNLRKNANRLSTPFDIYETLKDVLNFDDDILKRKDQSRGVSLFREITESRTCAEAGILPHWCACAERKEVSTSDSIIINVAKFLVKSINDKLKDSRDKCEVIGLSEIRSASRLRISDRVLDYVSKKSGKVKTQNHYQIKIKTNPGNALFEATIFQDERLHIRRVEGDISRINIYGNQSSCIKNNYELKKYCVCKLLV
ncbi:uncharacterized protein LOC133187952 [Saccostrea echinata]|uniref:uncharacterized protein LOC133187952 n=1 Tax=Saccostrea echinata TaxID=191078 RepID=UPI002A836A47|nr:uncharacterized protein LOC133187952 [Saccostrea echinata]